MKHLNIPTLFGSYAVLPKGLPIRVFGESDVKGEVTLALSDGTCRRADFVPAGGRFCVTLAPVDVYDDEVTLTVRAGEDEYVAQHIAVGIVLFAGGQSNMELMLKDVVRPLALYPTARMRFYTERHAIDENSNIIEKPASDVWYMADGVREMLFSAIGYFVAERLSRTLGVTVGVLSCNQGGSRIESWLSPEAELSAGLSELKVEFPDKNLRFNADHWLYHNKYVYAARYAVSAVLWYQGESNTGFGEGEYYGRYLHALIDEWRGNNENPRLPFYLVELASFDSVKAGWAPEPLGAWAPVREALVHASLNEHDVYTVSLTENENVAEIHPVNKYPLAEKLSRAILRAQFGYGYEYTGPVLDAARREGELLILTFTHAEGLSLRGGAACDAYFILADGTQTATDAYVEAGTLRVHIPAGAITFAVGYHNVPAHNLYNGDGYLASPFRVEIPVLA